VSRCRACGGGGVCQHGRECSKCKECKGSALGYSTIGGFVVRVATAQTSGRKAMELGRSVVRGMGHWRRSINAGPYKAPPHHALSLSARIHRTPWLAVAPPASSEAASGDSPCWARYRAIVSRIAALGCPEPPPAGSRRWASRWWRPLPVMTLIPGASSPPETSRHLGI